MIDWRHPDSGLHVLISCLIEMLYPSFSFFFFLNICVSLMYANTRIYTVLSWWCLVGLFILSRRAVRELKNWYFLSSRNLSLSSFHRLPKSRTSVSATWSLKAYICAYAVCKWIQNKQKSLTLWQGVKLLKPTMTIKKRNNMLAHTNQWGIRMQIYHWAHVYRIYSNKRRGAYLIFRATRAPLIWGWHLFKNCTRQIYFFYIYIYIYIYSTVHILSVPVDWY